MPTTCPAFNACGGNPQGVWVYTSGCVDNPFPELRQSCTGMTVSSATGQVSGCVAFSDTRVSRKATWSINATVFFPQSCVPGTCADLQTLAATYYPGATCSAAAGGCNCNLTRTGNVNHDAVYTVNGNRLIVNGSNQYEFCASGNAFSHREVTPGGGEPGNWGLTRN